MTFICGILLTFASDWSSGHFADFERLKIEKDYIEQTTEQTYITLANYIKDTLGGDVSGYKHVKGRITIEN